MYNDNDKSNTIVIKKKARINKLIAFNFNNTILKRSYFTLKLLKAKSKQQLDELVLKEYKKKYVAEKNKIENYKQEIIIIRRLIGFDMAPQLLFPYHNKNNVSLAFKRTNNYIVSVRDLLNKSEFNLNQAKFYIANFLHLFEYLIDVNILFRGFSLCDAYINKANGYIEY